MRSLDVIADDVEKACDAYTEACMNAANANNAFERAYHIALASNPAGLSVAASENLAKSKSLDEKAKARIAEAVEKSSQAKVRALLAELSAAQSQLKFFSGQDGGDR